MRSPHSGRPNSEIASSKAWFVRWQSNFENARVANYILPFAWHNFRTISARGSAFFRATWYSVIVRLLCPVNQRPVLDDGGSSFSRQAGRSFTMRQLFNSWYLLRRCRRIASFLSNENCLYIWCRLLLIAEVSSAEYWCFFFCGQEVKTHGLLISRHPYSGKFMQSARQLPA